MKRKNTSTHRKKIKDERNLKFPIRPDEIKLNLSKIKFFKIKKPVQIKTDFIKEISKIKEMCKHPKSRKKYKEKINE